MENIVSTVLALSGQSGYDDNGSDFDILRDLLITADLTGPVSSLENLTVFAPDDDAFTGLAATIASATGNTAPTTEEASIGFLADALTLLGGGNAGPLLTDILTYHVAGPVDGPSGPQAIDSTRLLADGGATMLNGGTITANIDSQHPLAISLADADPVLPDPSLDLSRIDLDGGNGIIHVIDGVLLPLPVADILLAPKTDFEIGDGSDEMFLTGAGTDFVDGNGGNDIIRTGTGKDVAIGGTGDDNIDGGRGSDTLIGEDGNDFIRGGWGEDSISGGSGNDAIFGGRGNDIVSGGDGDDVLSGGFGKDIIIGGAGDDVLLGGPGADEFVFTNGDGNDVLLRFGGGRDQIDLSGYEGIDDFNDIKDHISGGFFFSQIELLDGDSLTLLGFNVHNLDAGDFIF